MNEKEMDDWIKKSRGNEGTDSSLIAKIANETKSDNFQHLLIVTDGDVREWEIDKCDELVKQYDLKFSYVSVYIIGDNGNESVGCPFCRECSGVTYKYYNNGKKKQLSGVSLDDKKALENIDAINSWNEFENKYQN